MTYDPFARGPFPVGVRTHATTDPTRERFLPIEIWYPASDAHHFCDRIEEVHEMFRMMTPPGAFEEIAKRVPPIGELAPPEHGYRFVRGLGLAHMDATLKGDRGAEHFLTDIGAALAAQGVAVDVLE